MTMLPSKQKRHGLVDPIFILLLCTLAFLLVFAVLIGNVDVSIRDILGSLDNPAVDLSIYSQPSFSADQQYWAAHCSQGWSADATCERIISRSQSCSISSDSAYCSAYADYLQQYWNK